MKVNGPTPTTGKNVCVSLAIYEKVFSIISEVNYRCGPVKGTGLTVSDAFNVLLKECLGGLSGLNEIHFRVQKNDSENPDVFKMNVWLDIETSCVLDEITASLNKVMKLPWIITGEVILELLVRRNFRELRSCLFSKYNPAGFRPIKP